MAIIGCGFIGQAVVREALAGGHSVWVLDHNDPGPDVAGACDWIRADFGDPAAIRAAVADADVVFHLISTTVPADETDELEELLVNVRPTLQLLRTLGDGRARTLVFASSSSVYGSQADLPIPETAIPAPISSHGVQKLTLEKLCELHAYHHGFCCRVLRFSNPYGVGQPLNGRQGFIGLAIGALKTGRPLRLHGDGSAVRDFVYIDDVARACILAPVSARSPVLNIGSSVGTTLAQVLREIETHAGRSVPLQAAPARPRDIPVSVLDTTRAREELRWEARVSLAQGIAITLAHHGLARAA